MYQGIDNFTKCLSSSNKLDMKQGNIAKYNFIFLFKPLFTLGLRCICITNLYLVAVKHDLLSKVLHLTQRSGR